MKFLLFIRSFILIFSLAVFAGCGHADHKHGGEGQAEGHGGAHEEEGLPARAVTVWAKEAELFMEYEPPVVGREGKFAAHLSSLQDFKPVVSGTMTLVMTMEDGASVVARAEGPASPGIFRALIKPTKPGKCTLKVSIQSPQATDEINAGACEVQPDLDAALAASGEGEEAGGLIAFTKEQQWKTDFATAAAEERELQASVMANAEIRPASGNEARLTATSAGRVKLATPVSVLGTPVSAGQVLATISPRLEAGGGRAPLAAAVQSASAALNGAESGYARAERLFKAGAVPERNMEEARTKLRVARAEMSAARGQLQQYDQGAAGQGSGGKGLFQVRSPIAGILVEIAVAEGDNVEEGRALFTVIDLDRVLLVARVFEPDIPRVEGAKTAWFTVEGYKEPFTVNEHNGRLVTVGRVIDPVNRTVPVIFEIVNPQGKLRIGQFAQVGIGTGLPRRVLAVPESAIIEDAGKLVVYVQLEGEAFERRSIRVGFRSMGWVTVEEGLSAGDRVVTLGAYELKLTAASGAIPKHGHVH